MIYIELVSAIDPFILTNEILNDLFHGQIGNELIDGELLPRDRIEPTDALQMLLDVVAIVRDATGRDNRIGHELEANLAAQKVRYLAFLATLIVLAKQPTQLLESLLKSTLDFEYLLLLFVVQHERRRCCRSPLF